LCIVALRVGVHVQRVPSRRVPVCYFRHFCCSLYRLATKRTEKRVEENANVSFLRHRQLGRCALVYGTLRTVIH